MATIVSPAPERNATSARPRPDYGFALYFMLRATGFLASTMLMAFGVYVLFFLAIGGFSLDGMVNLALFAGVLLTIFGIFTLTFLSPLEDDGAPPPRKAANSKS